MKNKRNQKNASWKNFLYFLKKKFFVYFGEWNFLAQVLKNSHIFSEKIFLLWRELAKPRKQNFFIFWEMELSSPEIKKILFSKKISISNFLYQNFFIRIHVTECLYEISILSVIYSYIFFSLTIYLRSSKNTWGEHFSFFP